MPGVLLAAVPGWLAAHHVPLGLGPHSLAVLPLLPTALLMLLVARSASRAAGRLHLHEPSQARLVVFPIAGAHAIVGMTIALVLGNNGPVTANPPAAFFGCGTVAALAATVGVARRCCLLDAAFSRVDPVVVRGLRAGAMGVAAMSAAGAAVLGFGLVAHWTTATAIFEQSGSDLGTEFGMLLLTVAYLPNAIVAALSFAMGPGFTMGTYSVTPLHLAVAKLPRGAAVRRGADAAEPHAAGPDDRPAGGGPVPGLGVPADRAATAGPAARHRGRGGRGRCGRRSCWRP